MHPIPSQPPSVPDLKRAMNQVMFWCAGSRSARLGPPRPGNRHVQCQGRGEGEDILEVIGDWSAAPVLLGIQTSPEDQEDIRIPDGREEYGDLCGAYSMLESLSFADAYVDRRGFRVLEVRCRFFRVFYSFHLLHVPFRSDATNERVERTKFALMCTRCTRRTCARLETSAINADDGAGRID